MKKMMKVLALTLIAMLLLSSAAMADALGFEAANTNDTYHPEAPAYVEDTNDYAGDVYADPVITFSAVTPVSPAAVIEAPAIVPEATAPTSDYSDLGALQSSLGLAQEAPAVIIEDAPIPMSAGVANLFVEIFADKEAPNYADDVTLKSIVSFLGEGQLAYQWQINRGLGWENILDANATEYTFNYNESVSNCSFRLFVDVVAA